MMVFVDTSAFYAVLDADDANHLSAKAHWVDLIESDMRLVTTNYVLVETVALLQHRLGLAAVRALQDDVTPVFAVEWVSAELHAAAVAAHTNAQRRKVSLVDFVSFETMRRTGIADVFCFDPHFSEQGFKTVPRTAETAGYL